MPFDIEQAKKQVEAEPRLHRAYFLDACDEIERLEAYIMKSTESWERIVGEKEAEIERVKVQKAEAAEMWRAEIERLREAGEGMYARLHQTSIRHDDPILARWREVAGEPGVIQADKPFPDDEVFIGYGPSGP
jgi:hypothetical protein